MAGIQALQDVGGEGQSEMDPKEVDDHGDDRSIPLEARGWKDVGRELEPRSTLGPGSKLSGPRLAVAFGQQEGPSP
jgi:hypothetical protein